MKTLMTVIALALIAAVLAVGLSFASEKANNLDKSQASSAADKGDRTGESIDWEVVSSGGTNAASENFQLAGTSGQTAVGGGSSESYGLNQGFWQESESGPDYLCGDANADGLANITDAVYLIAYIFNSGPPPQPYAAGDANCDTLANITDAVYLIQYIFGGGAPPCDTDDNGEPDC